MAGSGVIFTYKKKYLIVEPTYKKEWELPGGIIEKDELPFDAAVREIKEELGFIFTPEKLAIRDYSTTNKNHNYLYCGKELTENDIKSIILPPDELRSFKIASLSESEPLLHPYVYKRLVAYLNYNNETLELVDGEIVFNIEN